MSFNVYLEIDTGGDEPATIANLGDCTGNLAAVFTTALDGTDIYDLHGHTAGEAAPRLRAAVTRMLADPAKFEAMNPPNGWGDADGACRFLANAAAMCARHPKTVICITR